MCNIVNFKCNENFIFDNSLVIKIVYVFKFM